MLDTAAVSYEVVWFAGDEIFKDDVVDVIISTSFSPTQKIDGDDERIQRWKA